MLRWIPTQPWSNHHDYWGYAVSVVQCAAFFRARPAAHAGVQRNKQLHIQA